MDDLELFEGPKESVNGAKIHIAQLKEICRPFENLRDYEIVTHTDPNTGEKVVKLRLKKRLPPRIRDLASDIIKKLRITLDQAFCDGALHLGRKDAKEIYFPFGRSIEDLNREVRKKCVGVDQRLVDFCLSFKPHYGEGSDGVLWSMSNLAGPIHRRIVALRPQDQGAFLKAVLMATGPLSLIVNKWNELYNEIEVARLPPGSELQIQNDFALTLEIIFSGAAHALSGRPLTKSLDHLTNVVERIVLGIEAEAIRLRRLTA